MSAQKAELSLGLVKENAMPKAGSKSRWKMRIPLVGLVLPVVLFLLWWWGSASGRLDSYFFSSPAKVAGTFGKLLLSGALIVEFWSTLQRILLGSLIGIGGGILLGGLTGYARQIERVLDPTVQALRAVLLR